MGPADTINVSKPPPANSVLRSSCFLPPSFSSLRLLPPGMLRPLLLYNTAGIWQCSPDEVQLLDFINMLLPSDTSQRAEFNFPPEAGEGSSHIALCGGHSHCYQVPLKIL